MLAHYFPDTTELQKQRTANLRLIQAADKNPADPGRQPQQEKETDIIKREREQVVREFCQKMQELGELYDEAWSRSSQAPGRQSLLNTKSYVVKYRMSDEPGSALLAVWVSGDRVYSHIFDDVMPDVPFHSHALNFSERNLSLIGPQEWERIVVAMKDRLNGN